ncbi:MAG: hypothetical protein ACRCSO_08380 [Sphingomonas sp.]
MTEDPAVKPTETQQRPNLSTERPQGAGGDQPATETQPRPNLSTEHQPDGSARHPTAGLDRGRKPTPDGGRKSSFMRNK